MDSDRIKFTSGGGCLMLFGLPFFCMGVFAAISPWLGVEWKDGNGNPASAVGPAIMGTIFGTVGFSIMFGRAVTTIDRLTQEVVHWWGVLVPFKTTRRSTKDFGIVTISREVRSSKNSSYTVFPVRLACEGPGDDANLVEPRDHREARRQAERVAKLLNLGVRDETGDTPTVREAGTLDISIRDQLRENPVEDPGPPPASLDVRREGTAAIVEVPALGIGPIQLIMVAASLGFVILPVSFLYPVFEDVIAGTEAFHPGHGVFALFGALFILGPPLMGLQVVLASLTFETIRVDPEGVSVIRTGRFRVSEDRLSFDEAEEVEIGRATSNHPAAKLGRPGVVKLSSDERTLECGRALEPDAVSWVCGLVRTIAGGGLPAALQDV